MFKISKRMDYAVRILVQLGLAGVEERVMSGALAGASGVPEAFLRKITADLVRHHLVHTYAGPNGGVALAQEPHQITMLQVYTAVEGPVSLSLCLLEPDLCALAATCAGYDYWDHLQAVIVRELEAATLDTLMDQAIALKAAPRCKKL